MKTILISFLLLAFFAIGCDNDDDSSSDYVASGITVQAGNVLGSGVCLTYGYTESAVAFDVDSAGANRTWHFDDYDWTGSFSFTYCTPQSCPFQQEFPTATRAVEINYPEYGYDWNLFEKVDQHGIWDIGEASVDEFYVYDPPHCRLELPCLYGTEWITARIDSMGDSDYWWKYIDSTRWVCDAWGKIFTPFDTCSVLRGTEIQTEYYSSSIDPVPHLNWTDVSYYWIDGHGDVVAWTSPTDTSSNYGYINLRIGTEDASTHRGGVTHRPPDSPTNRTTGERLHDQRTFCR